MDRKIFEIKVYKEYKDPHWLSAGVYSFFP